MGILQFKGYYLGFIGEGKPFYRGYIPFILLIEMAIAEFKTVVGTRKRITIPSKINIKEGEEVLVTIERVNPDGREKGGVS